LYYRNTIEKIIDFNFGSNYNSYFLLPEDGANYISLFWCKLQTHFKKMVQITHVVNILGQFWCKWTTAIQLTHILPQITTIKAT
jgi:hypothetical protein